MWVGRFGVSWSELMWVRICGWEDVGRKIWSVLECVGVCWRVGCEDEAGKM